MTTTLQSPFLSQPRNLQCINKMDLKNHNWSVPLALKTLGLSHYVNEVSTLLYLVYTFEI